MNNAELIVATLKKAGIGQGFGIPSGNALPLMEASEIPSAKYDGSLSPAMLTNGNTAIEGLSPSGCANLAAEGVSLVCWYW